MQAKTICASRYNTRRASSFISNVDHTRVKNYTRYWQQITPTNELEYYQRWLFAFMSIHTKWELNVKGFLALQELKPNFTRSQLRDVIVSCGCGLHDLRTRGIWEFHKRYWRRPKMWYPLKTETMASARTRLAAETYGIGLAKTSFVFEMSFPQICDVVCLDTHILQLYQCVGGSPSLRLYESLEDHWIKTCKKHKVSSPMVRHIYWDDVQNKSNTRYWSYVLESR